MAVYANSEIRSGIGQAYLSSARIANWQAITQHVIQARYSHRNTFLASDYAGISVTSTITLITGDRVLAVVGAAINEPDTGGTASGCRLTATVMWWLPTTSPDVESKPFHPAPGR